MQTKVKTFFFYLRIKKIHFQGLIPSDLELMDLVTQKLDNKTIILLGSPDMEIKSDYFNRVRMNTIQNRQVFCPIPFTEYHPALIYGDKRPPLAMVSKLWSDKPLSLLMLTGPRFSTPQQAISTSTTTVMSASTRLTTSRLAPV